MAASLPDRVTTARIASRTVILSSAARPRRDPGPPIPDDVTGDDITMEPSGGYFIEVRVRWTVRVGGKSYTKDVICDRIHDKGNQPYPRGFWDTFEPNLWTPAADRTLRWRVTEDKDRPGRYTVGPPEWVSVDPGGLARSADGKLWVGVERSRPDAFVWRAVSTPVALLRAVTAACGMTAPVGSVTVP